MHKKFLFLKVALAGLTLFPALVFAQLEPVAPGAPVVSLDGIISGAVNFVWIVFAAVGVVCFMWAGLLFLTAAGDSKKIQQAKTAVLWGLAGVLTGIIAFSIITIVKNAIGAS